MRLACALSQSLPGWPLPQHMHPPPHAHARAHRLFAEFQRRFMCGQVYISDPTWANREWPSLASLPA